MVTPRQDGDNDVERGSNGGGTMSHLLETRLEHRPPPPPPPPPPIPQYGIVTVQSAQDVDAAIPSTLVGEVVRIRVPFNMSLGTVLDIGEILKDNVLGQSLVEDPALLAAKLSQANWLSNELRLVRFRVEQLQHADTASVCLTPSSSGNLKLWIVYLFLLFL